jgi:SAM-dependent methyltransferase
MTDAPNVYDRMGEGFARRAFGATYNRLYDQPTVRALTPPLAGARVLDLACGPGAYFDWLLDAGAWVIAVDASAEMVRLANEHAAGRVEVRLHNADEPFDFLDDDSIDVVICALMIHYLDDPLPMLEELHRILVSDGVLVVSTQHPTTDWLRKGGSYFDTKLESDIWRDGETEIEVPYWRMPLTDLAGVFDEAGFVIDRLVEHRPDDTMRAADPDEYDILMTRPGFIAFRLRPRPAGW